MNDGTPGLTDSQRHFLKDMAIRSLDCREWIYALEGSLPGVDLEGLVSWRPEQQRGLVCLHDAIVSRLRQSVVLVHAGVDHELAAVGFHPRFGWTVQAGELKAFLGKTALLDGLRLRVGHRTYLSGPNCLRGGHLLSIGAFSSIGEGFYLNTACDRNPLRTPATYHMNCSRLIHDGLRLAMSYAELEAEPTGITIGDGVWIGRNVRIYHGARIGNGCVIAEGSLVRGNLEPYGIYAGRPASLKRFRFPEPMRAQLEAIRWWDWPLERIGRNQRFFAADLGGYAGDLRELIVP